MLHHARLEWSVETMHYFLDVHYLEDSCRLRERNSQRNPNMARKISLNLIGRYKEVTNLKNIQLTKGKFHTEKPTKVVASKEHSTAEILLANLAINWKPSL